MIDLHLRADTEADLAAALPFARGEDEEGNPIWLTGGEDFALHIIGPLVTTPGTYDDEGEELSPPVIDSRFHANLRTASQELADSVPAEVVLDPGPETPRFVWAS